MAVGANDIALRDLGQKSRPTDASGPLQDIELLRLGIPMIKVHRLGRKALAAVRARELLQLVEDFDVFQRAAADASELSVAILAVVTHVVGALTRATAHMSSVEHMFSHVRAHLRERGDATP